MSASKRFQPGAEPADALFIDSSALYAHYYRRDQHHDDVEEFFELLQQNKLGYYPLFVNDYVLDEVVTRLEKRHSHAMAVKAAVEITESGLFSYQRVPQSIINAAIANLKLSTGSLDDPHFNRDDLFQVDLEGISFTDLVIAHAADELRVDTILTYDGDFDRFGFTTIPHYEKDRGA